METETETDPLEINTLLQINELNLEEELASCPAHYYLFSKMACEADDLCETSTLKLEIYETQLTQDIKRQNASITQTDIKRYFRKDSAWQKLREDQLELQKNAAILDKASKSFEMKSRMLMSLNRRDLYKRSMNFKDNN